MFFVSGPCPQKQPLSHFFLNTIFGFFSTALARQLNRRHGGIVIFFAIFLALSGLTRLALLIKAAHDVTWTLSLGAVFFWGLIYDLGAAAFASLPLIVLLTLLPSSWLTRRWLRFGRNLSAEIRTGTHALQLLTSCNVQMRCDSRHLVLLPIKTHA